MQTKNDDKVLANHTVKQANWAMLWQHPAHTLALGLGSGLVPKMPGTAGTLLAWLLFLLLDWVLAPQALILLVLLSIPIGWWACTKTAAKLSMSDPGCIVWDEIAAFWLLLWAISSTLSVAVIPLWALQLLAFVGFRFFDAVKPQPVHWADSIFKGSGWRGGWGIMFDDIVAAGCTYLVLGLICMAQMLLAY